MRLQCRKEFLRRAKLQIQRGKFVKCVQIDLFYKIHRIESQKNSVF